ncbi:tyrosine-type recombinase/integrase [Oleiharenicola lentus]|uniref:tyrosine-type recombinase/integrase n=1 Tax=Oleiharenicola lentus TaxID=2508720 RepID=UPI003F661E0B
MKFVSTQVTNLVKAVETGRYYLRARVNRKLVWRTLDTNSFTVAKLRLADKMAEFRKAAPLAKASTLPPTLTFEQAVAIYKAEVESNPRLKPAAKDFRMRRERTLLRTWPEIFEMQLRRITPDEVHRFMQRYENGACRYTSPRAKRLTVPGDSPTTINSLIAFFRRIFDIGLKAGICFHNAARDLKRKRPTKKLLRLPNKSQFAEMVFNVRSGAGWGRRAGDLVEGLAYSGMRLGESRKMIFSHLDYERGVCTILGDKTVASERIVPMTEAFRALTLRIKERRNAQPGDRVFIADECAGSLKRACQVVGVHHMTHHDLRHLFATTCIESGVDIPTVALWLGHADGGVLAMATYGHIRPSHSVEAVKKVKFA